MLECFGSSFADARLFVIRHRFRSARPRQPPTGISNRYLFRQIETFSVFLEERDTLTSGECFSSTGQNDRSTCFVDTQLFEALFQFAKDWNVSEIDSSSPYSNDCLVSALSLFGRFISTRVTWDFGWLNFSVSKLGKDDINRRRGWTSWRSKSQRVPCASEEVEICSLEWNRNMVLARSFKTGRFDDFIVDRPTDRNPIDSDGSNQQSRL